MPCTAAQLNILYTNYISTHTSYFKLARQYTLTLKEIKKLKTEVRAVD